MNKIRVQTPRWIPTQDTVREMLAPALVFIVACLDRQFQTDFWMHLARGGEIVHTGDFLTTDHFTIAGAGEVIRDLYWLSEVFYFRLFSWGGLPLIQACNALVLAGSVWLLVRLARRNGASSRAAGAAGVIAFLVAWQTFLIRPQTFSMLLFVLLYAVLSRPRRATLLLWPPAILLLWVNLHGGFLIGLVLIGIFTFAHVIESACEYFLGAAPSPGTAGEGRGEGDLEFHHPWCSKSPSPQPSPRIRLDSARRRPGEGARQSRQSAGWYLASLLLSFLATLINPSGWRVYQYAFSLTARVLPRHIEEWLPPPMNQWIGQALVASGLLIAALYLVQRRRPAIRDCLLMLCFFPLALHSARMVVWWAIVATPIMASLFRAVEGPESLRSSGRVSVISTAFCAILAGMCVLSLPCLERFNPIFTSIRSPHRTESDLDAICRSTGFQPVALARFQGSVIFTRLEWGQYLDWKLGPQGRIFIDGHVELASDQAWRDYCRITSGMPRWEELLDQYRVDCLLLDRNYHSALLSQLKDAPQWTETCRAGDAILLVRTPPRTLAHEATMARPIVIPKETTGDKTVGASGAAASAGTDPVIRGQ
jgi:hypothetical protein